MFNLFSTNKQPGQNGGTSPKESTPTPPTPRKGLLKKAPPPNIRDTHLNSIPSSATTDTRFHNNLANPDISRPPVLSLPTPPTTPSSTHRPQLSTTLSSSSNHTYLSASTGTSTPGRYSTVHTIRTTQKGHPALTSPAVGFHFPETASVHYTAMAPPPGSTTSSSGDDFHPSPPRPIHHRSHSSTNSDSLQLPPMMGISSSSSGSGGGGANTVYGNSRYSRSFNALTSATSNNKSGSHSHLFSTAQNRSSMRLIDNFEQVYSSNIKSLSGRGKGAEIGFSPDGSRPGTAKSLPTSGKNVKVVPIPTMLTFRWLDGGNEVESYHYGPLGRGDRVPDLYLITGDVEVYVEMARGEWSSVPVFKIKESPLMHMLFEKQITYATDDDQAVGEIREPQMTPSVPTLAVPEDDLTFGTLASRSSMIGAARPVSTLMSLDYSHMTKRGRNGGDESEYPPLRPAILQSAEDGAEEIVESQAKYRIHVPFPAELEGANNILQYFIDLRNLFAFLDQQYLVGCQIGRLTPAAALVGVHDFIFKTILNDDKATPEFEKVFYESADPFFQYQVQDLDLTDVRNNPEQMVAVLAVAEKWKNASLYSLAFTHLLGNWEHHFKIASNPAITSQLSLKSRQLLEKNIFEFNSRISTLDERLREFQFHSIVNNLASNSEYPTAWTKGYQTMRKFYMKHLKNKFGSWPPKPSKPNSKTMQSGLDVLDGGINRVVIRECYWDMTRLYTLLVDTQRDCEGKVFELKDNLDANGLLGKVLHEFDEERPPVQPHVPFLLPLTPEIPKDFEKKKAKRSDPFLQWFNTVAYNPTSSEKILESLTDGVKKIELDTKGNEVLEQRRGMWIFIYAVLQTLVRGLDLPSLLAQSNSEALKGISYFLCQSNGDAVPWVKSGSGSRPISFGGSGMLNTLPRGETKLSEFERAYTNSFIWQQNERYRTAIREKQGPAPESIAESSLYDSYDQQEEQQDEWSPPTKPFEALNLQNLDYPLDLQDQSQLTPLEPPPLLRETMPGYVETDHSTGFYDSRRGSAATSGPGNYTPERHGTPPILRAGSPSMWGNAPSSGPNSPPVRPGSSSGYQQQFPPRNASHQLPPVTTSRPSSSHQHFQHSPLPQSPSVPYPTSFSNFPPRPLSVSSNRPFSRAASGSPPLHPLNTAVSPTNPYQAYSPTNSRPASRSGSNYGSRRNSTLALNTIQPLFSAPTTIGTQSPMTGSPIRLVESPESFHHEHLENHVRDVEPEVRMEGIKEGRESLLGLESPRVELDLDFGFGTEWQAGSKSAVKGDEQVGMAR